ncbi:hypothetical protein BYT27DRAFT_7196460 [Phlegmacium glaucopus]|nr:hypothetical protein BYT27DRAFT_7196460 [Phlegmacium glaucopus]
MFPPFFILLRWLKFKKAVRISKLAISNATKRKATAVKQTAIAAKNKVKNAKKAASRAAKDKVLSIPGVSKIQLPEPPFPHLLLSNTPPSDAEAIDILKVISVVEAQTLEIIQEDTMISHQLDRANQFLHDHRSILSVIRRIPPEILQEIFIQTILPWENCRWNTVPWSLPQVCRLWRITALSISTLWSKLPTIYLHKKTPRSYVAQITELLVRSRDAPISFYLCAPFKELDSHPIIDALVLHSERWQTVAIDSTNLTIFAFKGVKGRLSSLRTLSLEVWRQTDPVVLDIFEDAPQLREVHLDGPFPGAIRLPFSQLTRYKERVRGRGMADYTISLATSLTTLEVSRFYESPGIPVITLPSLTILKVQFDDVPPQGFLDNLTLPAIQEIWVAGFEGHLITVLTAMISRSHSPCMLKKFAFRASEMESGELTKFLKLTPHLIDLNLPLPPSEDLTNLIIGQNSRPLVPLLQVLTIEADAIRRVETSQLLNALAVSRCSNPQTSTVPGDGGGDGNSYLQDDYRALTELRIIFKTISTCHYELRFLEDWLQSEGSDQLEMWKDRLVQELPELVDRPASRKRKFDLKWCNRVFDILSDIEKFQVKNVNDIYISEIHTTLRRLAHRHIGRSTSSIIPELGNKAREILDKWTPLFESHFKDRRWVLKGNFSLIYLSPDDALRTSLTRLDILYGMKDNLQFSEIFWPIYMLY